MSHQNSSWSLHANPQSGKKPGQTSMVNSVPPPSYSRAASNPSQGFVNPANIFNSGESAGTGTSSYSSQTQVTMGPYGQSNDELPYGMSGVRKRPRTTTSHDQGTQQTQQPLGMATRTHGQQATNPCDAQSAVPQGHLPQPWRGPPPS